MLEDTINTRGNKYKLLPKHCHYDVESGEPRCLTVPNFIKIIPTLCEILCFFWFFKMVASHLEFFNFWYFWLTWYGGPRCITNPNFVQIGQCVVEIKWFHDFSIWLQLTIWSSELRSAFYPRLHLWSTNFGPHFTRGLSWTIRKSFAPCSNPIQWVLTGAGIPLCPYHTITHLNTNW